MWNGGARAIIIEDDRVLLVKQRHEGRDIWMLPGGTVDENEDSRQAAKREVKEETGLEVEIGKLIWHIEEVSARGQRFVNFFLAKKTGGELIVGKDPEMREEEQVIEEVRFVSKEEMQTFENIYPEALREELWEITKNNDIRDSYRMRKQTIKKGGE